jgi:hypothetical protein
MNEVYLARDPTLKCDVALNVLPEAEANDPSRMARFQRQADRSRGAVQAATHEVNPATPKRFTERYPGPLDGALATAILGTGAIAVWFKSRFHAG